MLPLSSDFLRSREAALQSWFAPCIPRLALGPQTAPLAAVSGDASFRRYFRASLERGSCILVDAPPPQEDCRPFVDTAALLAAQGVGVPALYACDLKQGFMCLEDLGDTLLWGPLDAARRNVGAGPDAAPLYRAAFAELLKIQRAPTATLAPYDTALLARELHLFDEWFCRGLLRLELDAGETALLEHVYGTLIASALAQPRVCVHRDYHSRNLLYRGAAPLGVIDFQDAVAGPATYDLVSLLRDCYIEWPPENVRAWALDYAALARAAAIPLAADDAAFLRDFDLMGMQRHLKVLGIFARLWLRDGKPGYLADLPLTLRYLRRAAGEHPQFAAFVAWLQARIVPALPTVLSDLGVEPRS
ncbi:MAG TPA: phosphotransferase [Hyphomicrobiales bacterium]|nr:phosphotransferase [Hyphomicrobiales bacterium]